MPAVFLCYNKKMLGRPFTPEHIKGLQEREDAFFELEKLGNIWTGHDVAIEKPTIVNPGEVVQDVKIILSRKHLPPVNITRGSLRSLGWSVRSFFAQVGIEINFYSGDLSDNMLSDLNSGKDTLVPVNITNHGQRAVEVKGEVMRFFWANDGKRLRGLNLVNKIKSGEFAVEGVEGEDWFLGGYEDNDKYKINEKGAQNALCVVVRLKPEKFYVPYAPEPVKKDNSKETRGNLTDFLKPIPEGENISFEVGETPKIKLGPNLVGVINLGVSDKGQKHINSPLIDPGSHWPIRTETLHGLSYIDIFLYEK